MRYAYPVDLVPDETGYTVTAADVPGLVTWGATPREALDQAADALVSALSVFVEEGRPLPHPSPAFGRPVVPVGALEAAKLALHDAMVDAGVSNMELARGLALDEKAIRRLRDPLHRSHIGTIEAALHHLGKRMELIVADAAV